jgi:hypothetical protein
MREGLARPFPDPRDPAVVLPDLEDSETEA